MEARAQGDLGEPEPTGSPESAEPRSSLEVAGPAAEPEVAEPAGGVGDGEAAAPIEEGSGPTSGDIDSDAAELPGETSEIGEPTPWRSALFPEDWTPEWTSPAGLFLHDLSWAGYQHGEAPLPETIEGPVVDVVVEHGADPTGVLDATAPIQAAIDQVQAAGGGVVHVPAGLYRVEDLLSVTASHVVIRGEGPEASRLYFTRDHDMQGVYSLRLSGEVSVEAELPLVADAAGRDLIVQVADASGLAPGDDVEVGWVITEAFVEEHGMAGTWKAFNGKWQTFFRRNVAAVDLTSEPHVVTLDVPLRYPTLLRDQAAIRKVSGYLQGVGVRELGLANAVGWSEAWAYDRAHVLGLVSVSDAFVQDVHSFPSPAAPTEGYGADDHLQSGGIMVKHSKRVTVADCVMERAQNRGGGGNGYLYEIMASSEVLTRDSVGRAGRHNFIQNWGFGTTGCVWLRCLSEEGVVALSEALPLGAVGVSEYHHSLATANLVDDCTLHDGWKAENRQDWSSGAGHTATETILWRPHGQGRVFSRQFGMGYVIGADLEVITVPAGQGGEGTAPEDWNEGVGLGATLVPASLYEAQLELRLGGADAQTP